MAIPSTPPLGSGQTAPVTPTNAEHSTSTTSPTVEPSVDPKMAGKDTSKSFTTPREKNLGQRKLTSHSSETGLPSVKLKPEHQLAINKSQETYREQINTLRDLKSKQFLRNNHKKINNYLENPKKANGAPFKVYIVVNGKKELVLPDQNGILEKNEGGIKEVIKQTLDQTVNTLPTKKELSKAVKGGWQGLIQNFSVLKQLGVQPKTDPKSDVEKTGFRIDFSSKQPPVIRSYYLEGSSEQETDGSDGIEFEDVN